MEPEWIVVTFEVISSQQMIKNRSSGGIISVSISTSDSNMTPEKTQAPIRYPSDLIDEE